MDQKREQLEFWVSKSKKSLCFHAYPNYEEVTSSSRKEMWELIHLYIESGYKVH